MKNRASLLLWIILTLFTSCVTTDNFRVLRTEVYGPGLLATDSIDIIDTIAIINRSYDINYVDYDTFYYKIAGKEKMVKDTMVKYEDLSNTCTDALADYLLQSGYFKAVVNYRDSMIQPLYAQKIAQRQQDSIYYDACIYLDFIGLKDELMPNAFYFDKAVIFSFPEFEHSTMMETVGTRLRWSIWDKKSDSPKAYRRVDDLFYGNSVNHDLFGSEENHRKLLKNTAGSLGKSFANELIPHWQPATRIYYRSHNPLMLTAQKYLLSEKYREAAEIYRRLTNNKNKNIAAKATYNMALICETEGNLEAALDWVYRSGIKAKKFDYKHTSRCEEYRRLLQKRQIQIELINKQANYNDSIAGD